MVQLETSGKVFYLYSITTMAVNLAVSTQYTNVTDTRHRATAIDVCLSVHRAAISV